MTGSLQLLLQEAVAGLKGIFGGALDSVILYGSYARGDFDEQSDIDLMAMLLLPQESFVAYRPLVARFASDLGLKYDVLVSIKLQDKALFDQYRNVLPFYQNVKRDGVLMYG